jgi:topoisomerase-4 subunit A
MLKPRPRLKKLTLEFDFAELEIKGRNSMGNILTKHMIHKIYIKEKGFSTLTGQKIWFDWDVLRLNIDQRGQFIGEYKAQDKILVISKLGYYRMTNYELSNHYEDEILKIEKYRPNKTYSAVYYDPEKKFYFLKRFEVEYSERNAYFIPEEEGAKMICLSEDECPQLKIVFGGRYKERPEEIVNVLEFIGVKGYKAKGKRLTTYEVGTVEFIEPIKTEQTDFDETDIENMESDIENGRDDENLNEDLTIPFEITDKDGNQKIFDF